MTMMIYAIYDSKTEIYSQPHFLINKGTASRAWADAANDPQSPFSKHPADYTMFEIGHYNDITGNITMHQAKIPIGSALEFRQGKQTTPNLEATNAI